MDTPHRTADHHPLPGRAWNPDDPHILGIPEVTAPFDTKGQMLVSLRRRLLRWLVKAPVVLYDARAGWLLGHRFLLLRHRGRRSQHLYSTVLEVVAWRPAAQEAVVVSGLGHRSQWYRNVLAGQAVEVQVARLRFVPGVRPLGIDEAVGVLADYERHNRLAGPLVRAVLSKLAGFRYDGSDAARRRVVAALPMVAFRPLD